MQRSDNLAWPAAVLFPVVMLLLFANVLVFDVQTHQGLLEPSALPTTLQLLDAFADDGPLPLVFNEREQAHLEDVKIVLHQLLYVLAFLAVLFFILLWFTRVELVLLRGFGLLLVLAGVLAVLPFDLVFERFHAMMFAPGSWVFALDSTLIKLYPFSFFQAFFQHIMALTVTFAAVLALYAAVGQKSL